jgi:methyl-accepting chemotaxis protein
MLQSKSLKTRIILLVAPALVALLGFSAYVSVEKRDVSLTAENFVENLSSFSQVSQFIHEIQKERGMSGLYMKAKVSDADISAQREKTSAAYRKLTATSAFARKNSFISLQDWKLSLEKTRELVNEKGSELEPLAQYTNTIANLIQVQSVLAREYNLKGFEGQLNSLLLLETSKENFGRLRARVSALLADNQPLSEDTFSQVQKFRTAAVISLDSPALVLSKDGEGNIKKVKASEHLKAVEAIVDLMFKKSREGNYGIAGEVFFQQATRLVDETAKVLKQELNYVESEVNTLADLSDMIFWGVFSFFCFGFVLFVWMSWSFIFSVSSSLGGVAQVMHGTSQTFLKHAMEMTTASDSLSSGSAEQGSAMEETAASLDEIRSIISKNADNAQSVQNKAKQCVADVTRGLDVVAELNTAMSAISLNSQSIDEQIRYSNEQLSEIINVISEIESKTKVINDIVFQTKLLSFNASVEAARAGEHGKGFAVVAEEVGNLARMSGTASKEISDLLGKSVDKVKSIVHDTRERVEGLIQEAKNKVGEGTEIALRCSQVLDEIIMGVSSMNERAEEVALGSQEQTKGVDEISGALHQLTEVNHHANGTASDAQKIADQLRTECYALQGQVKTLYYCVNGLPHGRSEPTNRSDSLGSVYPGEADPTRNAA